MANSTPDASALAPSNLALATPPKTLELRPVEGLPTLVGRTLHRWLFRILSMIEIPARAMKDTPVVENEDWFRRDRYRHPRVDPGTYQLRVTGVASPRTFSLQDLRTLPWEERLLVMECAGNGNHWMGTAGLVAQARWRGPSLATVLDACGGPGEAQHFAFYGLDPMPLVRPGYNYGLSLEELERSRALLALEMNGVPLPRARGFPVRLVVPGIYSMSHVKWLGHIEGKQKKHQGFWNRMVFVNKERRDGKWTKVEARWIGLKSMITRCEAHPEGWELQGWAWGGQSPVERVEITTDGGETWEAARLTTPDEFFPDSLLSPADVERAWSTFRMVWSKPDPGEYTLGCRAFSADGRAQPFEGDANVKGHFDVTRVKWRRVTVPG